MTPLGKPVVFYLKYMAEMNRLYAHFGYAEGEAPDLTDLDDAEQVKEMVRTVGATAYEQAADFLELCGKVIEDHLSTKGAVLTKKRKRSSVVDNWAWGARFDVPSVPGGHFSCGVFLSAPPEVGAPLPAGACGVVVPWIWSKGGRKGADAVWQILGDWSHSRAGGGLVEANGDIALACIPVKAQPSESFDVDRDQLIGEVANTIGRIGSKEVKAIARYVAALNEPDES